MEDNIMFDINKADKALRYCIDKERANIPVFGGLYPCPQSRANLYDAQTNYDWTNSFYSGMLWLAYENTKEECFINKAKEHSRDFRSRIENRLDTLETHDIGFLYSLSCVADYKLTGDESAKETALMAAELLIKRFRPEGGFIQAWGSLDDESNYRLIIDCLLNLPLLFWASEVTGDDKYREIAITHAHTALKYAVRDDFTTYHTFYFDPATGAPSRGETCQGYSDSSCWARGQAWGIYGSALAYAYTGDESFIPIHNGVTDLFISRLPDDSVPYWDMIFTEGDEPRDTSAAAIAVCGILEMSRHIKNEEHMKAAERMMESLIGSYMTDKLTSTGLLTDAMYSSPNGDRPECNIWGDYYFMEALVRIKTGNKWKMYW